MSGLGRLGAPLGVVSGPQLLGAWLGSQQPGWPNSGAWALLTPCRESWPRRDLSPGPAVIRVPAPPEPGLHGPAPAPPPPRGLWGPVHPQSLSHGSSPACWDRPRVRPRGGAVSGPRFTGLSRDPAFWIWGPRPPSGCTPSPDLPTAGRGADLPGDPSQGPPALVRRRPRVCPVPGPALPWPELVADPPQCPSRGGRSRRLSRAQRSLVPRCPPRRRVRGSGLGGLRAGPGFGATRARTRPRPRPERRAPPRARPGGARTH